MSNDYEFRTLHVTVCMTEGLYIRHNALPQTQSHIANERLCLRQGRHVGPRAGASEYTKEV